MSGMGSGKKIRIRHKSRKRGEEYSLFFVSEFRYRLLIGRACFDQLKTKYLMANAFWDTNLNEIFLTADHRLRWSITISGENKECFRK